METTTTEADGRTSRSSHWEQREEQVSRLERRCPFGLRQDDLELAVDPTGAELELETVVDNLEPEAESRPQRLHHPGAIQVGCAASDCADANRCCGPQGGSSWWPKPACHRTPVPRTTRAGGLF